MVLYFFGLNTSYFLDSLALCLHIWSMFIPFRLNFYDTAAPVLFNKDKILEGEGYIGCNMKFGRHLPTIHAERAGAT